MKDLLKKGKLSRRKFLATTAAVGVAMVVPRNVLGRGFIAPSDKITMLHVGCGYQGFSEIGGVLRNEEIEVVGVADPNRQSNDYLGWSPNDQRNRIRTLIEEPNWFDGVTGHPGGRDVMKYVVETFYKKNRAGYTGTVQAHEDYRELLATMRDVDAVKIIPCDHLHSYIAVDCIKRGKHIIMHKPLGNKLHEAMKVVDTALANPRVATNLSAYGQNAGIDQAKAWIDAGAIGKLKEIHNWSDRPFWPQYQEIPTERVPIPRGFNWDLWLGPSQMREYSPKYTHCNFRGWFEFGGGSIADMGIYSMLYVFERFQLNSAVSASSRFARVYSPDIDQVPRKIVNTWSFPLAGGFRFELPQKAGGENIFYTWHDGGMKPNVPSGYPGDDLPVDGMMYIGENAAIVAGFRGASPQLIGLNDRDMRRYANVTPPARPQVALGTPGWIADIKGTSTRKSPSSFEFAKELSETYALGAVSMMCDGKKLTYDPATRRVTNDEAGNRLLHRDTRRGWEFV
jgi:predicted dehydrogenase